MPKSLPQVKKQPSKNPKRKAATSAQSTAEIEVEIVISSADRVVYSPENITKGDVALYYQRIAPLILPHLINRPISLLRCPDGVSGGKCFFQRHKGSWNSAYVHDITIDKDGDDLPYVYIRDEAGLLSLVQMGVLEFHAWGATAAHPDKPDRITFDFDPDEAVDWDQVKEAAQTMRHLLKKLGLESFLKSTGGKGLHVVAPITPGPDWETVKRFTQALANVMTEAEPDKYTTNIRKAARKGRIFIDYLRNDDTATAIAPYSLRARAGAPVALPLAWSELAKLDSGNVCRLDTLPKKTSDPWKQFWSITQKLPSSS